MPKYRLLAIDIDGTLVNSRDELSPRTRDALLSVGEAGVQIVLATGRRYRRALPLVEPLGIDVPLVTNCGALIKHPRDHQTLFRAHLKRELLCDVLGVVASAGHEAVLYGDTYLDGFDYYCARLDVHSPELQEFYMLNAGCERLWPVLMTDPPDDIFACFAIGARDEMLRLHDRLQGHLPERLYTHVLRSPRYRGYMCEIAPATITKWFGIQHLAADWGISADEICAVGDDVNDIPMIEGSGLGIAMGNAPDEVRAVADRVAPPHDEDGLVQVVEWVLAS